MKAHHSRSESIAVNAGLASNIFLAFLKTIVGILGHSGALLADGVNSMSDTAYYVVVKVFLWLAGKPPDRAHPYGHRQLESIAALAVGSFVMTTAIALFWDAVNKAYDILTTAGEGSRVGPVAMWVALLTICLKVVLTVYTSRVAGRTGNAAILALARDHRNDIFSAGGAAVGILLSRMGYAWGDPVMAAAVAVVVLMTGIQILRESSSDLMDTVPGDALEAQTREALGKIEGVKSVEEVLAHRFGPYIVLNITIGVDGVSTVYEGDRIASEVEGVLMARMSLLKRVHVHYHPFVAAGEYGTVAQQAGSGLGTRR